MATFQNFEDIEAWQKARELTKEIYQITRQGKFAKDYGLRDQICRASVSIMSNIAEGYDRGGTGEFLQFLSVAKGSVGEVRSQLYVAADQNYISKTDFDRLSLLASRVSRIIGGLMTYLRKTNLKGVKFKRTLNPEP